MKRVWHTPAKVVAGLFVAALYAMPQVGTISARPGVVNYIEGTAYINDAKVSAKTIGKTYLNANDTLSTDNGKAEVLLTPGVFLRVGNDSEIRMISPSLTKTEVGVTKGEAMVEVAQLVKQNDIEIVDHGATIKLEKVGLYRFTADDTPVAETLEGKAQIQEDDKKVDLGKGRKVVLTASLKPEKFDTKQQDHSDDLFAWSKVRDEYDSAASFAAAKQIQVNNNYFGGGWGYGFGPGWLWNSGWNSWAWLPGDGAFFSPFGYGFFAPAYVGYAPVMYAPVYGRPGTVVVPVNPKNPIIASSYHGPINTITGQPWHGSTSGNIPARSGYWAGRPATAGATSAARPAAPSFSGGAPRGFSGGAAAHAAGGGGRR
jgi:hypothetical protein